MGNEYLRKSRFLMDHANNGRSFESHDHRVCHGRDGRYALRLPGKTRFTEEFVRSKNCDDGLLALLRNNGDLGLASLDVEDSVRGISLRKHDLVLAVFANGPSLADLREKGFRIERWSAFDRHDSTFRARL